ncbi:MULTISPECIES: hypothetical protein [Brucella]|nr:MULTISPECIES: hypothetical protein [Brucella]MCR8490647.1 hypothetical protein [Brucella anthropi]
MKGGTSCRLFACGGYQLLSFFKRIASNCLLLKCDNVSFRSISVSFKTNWCSMNRFLLCVVSLTVISGCASQANKIEPSYASSAAYDSLSCHALKEEGVRLSASAATAVGRQNAAAKNDAIKTGVGLVLFWPVLLFNEGNGVKAAEVARLKGEMQALERAAGQKGCNITFRSY